MCTVPSQFGIPQSEIGFLGYMGLLCINRHWVIARLADLSTHLCQPQLPQKLSKSKAIMGGFSSVNFHHLIPWARPLHAMVQPFLSKSISFPVTAIVSTWVFMKHLFGSQILQFVQRHYSSALCHGSIHKTMKLKAWYAHASSYSDY